MRTYTAVLAPIAFLASTAPAYAYLDPGSGSMMVQLLLGGVAGGVVLVRLYWGLNRTGNLGGRIS